MFSELDTTPNIYINKFPNFGKPKIIGFFSLDTKRQYHADTSQLKYLREASDKEVSYDLNLTINETNRKPLDLNEKLTNLLKFLMDEDMRLKYVSAASTLDKAHFYCYRGLLTCIACTPYENKEPWRIVATLFEGHIYLCILDTVEKIDRIRNTTDKDRQFTSWGYKFEQFVLSDSPNSMPNSDEPVDENEEFNLVYATHLNQHKLIFGAEMDGIKCDIKIDDPPQSGLEEIISYLSSKEFVELKTNRHIEYANQDKNFRRFKLKKWWCQSFLAGVGTVMCGFRNDSGTVEKLKVFTLKEFVKMSERFWKPEVCFNFLNTFLTYVKRCLAKQMKMKYGEKYANNLQNMPLMTLHFEWSPHMPVRVTNNYSFDTEPILPDWFVNNEFKKRFREMEYLSRLEKT